MTDESGIDYGAHIEALLDGALGPQGYYGVFTANMHTDDPDHEGANTIVAEAKRRGVPVVSAKQMLTWLDGRDDSSFGGLVVQQQRAAVLDPARHRAPTGWRRCCRSTGRPAR